VAKEKNKITQLLNSDTGFSDAALAVGFSAAAGGAFLRARLII
jgi:hypothetical protein